MQIDNLTFTFEQYSKPHLVKKKSFYILFILLCFLASFRIENKISAFI